MSTSNQDGSAVGQNNTSSVGQQKSPEELMKEIEALRNHNQELLSEKKKVSEKLKNSELTLKEREEKELKEKEDYKTLLKNKEEELLNVKTDLEREKTQRVQGMKLDAFLSIVDGKVDPKYWGMIDLNKIVVNPDSGEVDSISVSKYVDTFKKEYPELIKTGQHQSTPANAPSNGEVLTYEKWLTLPLKEQKARYKEMIANNK